MATETAISITHVDGKLKTGPERRRCCFCLETRLDSFRTKNKNPQTNTKSSRKLCERNFWKAAQLAAARDLARCFCRSNSRRCAAGTPSHPGGAAAALPLWRGNPSRSLLFDRFIKGEPAALTLAVTLFVSNIRRSIGSECLPLPPGSNLHTNAGSLFLCYEKD